MVLRPSDDVSPQVLSAVTAGAPAPQAFLPVFSAAVLAYETAADVPLPALDFTPAVCRSGSVVVESWHADCVQFTVRAPDGLTVKASTAGRASA